MVRYLLQKCTNATTAGILRAMMSLTVAKWLPHDASASVQLRTEEGSGSDQAKTLTITLGRWFLPRVPHSLHVDRTTGVIHHERA